MKDKPVILVVDDEPQNIELLEAYLVPQGYEIVKAANGEEALGKLSGNQIDLILLDIIMPGMDGFEVTRRVRGDDKNCLLPIILVTVLRESEERIKGIEAGCDDFITMPDDKMELLPRVRSLLKVKAYNDLMSNYRKELESEVIRRTEGLKHAMENLQQEIGKRKRSEESLRESEEKFRTIFDTASDGILIADAITKKFLHGNTAICSMLGYTKEEIESLTINDIHPPKEISHVIDEFEKQAKGEKVLAEDLPVLRKDGSIFYADIGSSPAIIGGVPCLLGIFRDITDRKRAEEDLKESENKYRLLADNVDDVIFVLDMNLNYTYISPSVKILRGYEPEEVLKHAYFETLTPSSLDMAMSIFSEVMELEKSGRREIPISRTLQLEMIRKDGTTVWTEVKFSFIRDENQRPVGILGVTRDITARKLAEEKLQWTLENLRKAFIASIQLMVSAVESRDPYTAGHQIRPADVARAIATG